LRKDGEGKNVGALKQACWHGEHGGHRCRKELPRQRCKTPMPLLCYTHRTGSSSGIASVFRLSQVISASTGREE